MKGKTFDMTIIVVYITRKNTPKKMYKISIVLEYFKSQDKSYEIIIIKVTDLNAKVYKFGQDSEIVGNYGFGSRNECV